jgi:hypothetical protein
VVDQGGRNHAGLESRSLFLHDQIETCVVEKENIIIPLILKCFQEFSQQKISVKGLSGYGRYRNPTFKLFTGIQDSPDTLLTLIPTLDMLIFRV